MPVRMLMREPGSPQGMKRCIAAIGTRLATPSSLRSKVPIAPTRRHKPRKCRLSAIGHAQAVRMRCGDGRVAADRGHQPDFESHAYV